MFAAHTTINKGGKLFCSICTVIFRLFFELFKTKKNNNQTPEFHRQRRLRQILFPQQKIKTI